jgi:hypothetical protein
MGLVSGIHAFRADRSEPLPDRDFAMTFRCTECDNEVTVGAGQTVPPCLICKGQAWEPLDAAQHPVVRRLAER